MFLRRYKFSLLIVCAILYLSFFTPPQTDLGEITNFDKFVHFSMYFGFTGIIWLEYAIAHGMLRRRSKKNTDEKGVFDDSSCPAPSLPKLLSFGWLGPIALSGLIELGQAYLTTTRSGEWLDFLANSLGATAAVLIASTILLLLKRKRIQ